MNSGVANIVPSPTSPTPSSPARTPSLPKVLDVACAALVLTLPSHVPNAPVSPPIVSPCPICDATLPSEKSPTTYLPVSGSTSRVPPHLYWLRASPPASNVPKLAAPPTAPRSSLPPSVCDILRAAASDKTLLPAHNATLFAAPPIAPDAYVNGSTAKPATLPAMSATLCFAPYFCKAVSSASISPLVPAIIDAYPLDRLPKELAAAALRKKNSPTLLGIFFSTARLYICSSLLALAILRAASTKALSSASGYCSLR